MRGSRRRAQRGEGQPGSSSSGSRRPNSCHRAATVDQPPSTMEAFVVSVLGTGRRIVNRLLMPFGIEIQVLG
jgi:hypothetical protein